jgi:hypothetical protein
MTVMYTTVTNVLHDSQSKGTLASETAEKQYMKWTESAMLNAIHIRHNECSKSVPND